MDRDVDAEIVLAGKLRAGGASIREIATELGCSVSTAHGRLRAWADAEQVVGDLDDRGPARIREAATLDAWQDVAEQQFTAEPSPEWLRALTSLSARRSRLLGIDAPARVHVSDDRTLAGPDPEIVAAIAEACEQNAAERDVINRRPRRTGEGDGPADVPEPDA